MKIAFVLDVFPSLSQTFVLDQVTGLIDRGHEVKIFAAHRGRDQQAQPSVEKYRLYDCLSTPASLPSGKWKKRFTLLAILFKGVLTCPVFQTRLFWHVFTKRIPFDYDIIRLALLVRNVEAEIVHCHFARQGVAGAMAVGAGLNTKLVCTFHGYDVNTNDPQNIHLYQPLFERGDIFTVNTTFTAEQAKQLGCPGDKIEILPVGLIPDRFRYRPREYKQGRTVKILTVARLVEKKGIRYCLEAVAKLKAKNCDFRYTIAGEGPLLEELKQCAAKLGISEFVTFTGPVSQDRVVELYDQNDLFVLASVTASNGDREGQGLVLQEAQYCGLPVISTLHNGIPDGVLDGQSGFLVPEGDSDAITERLEYLIMNPDTWPEMGRKGHQFVRENYDISKLNERLISLYSRLL